MHAQGIYRPSSFPHPEVLFTTPALLASTALQNDLSLPFRSHHFITAPHLSHSLACDNMSNRDELSASDTTVDFTSTTTSRGYKWCRASFSGDQTKEQLKSRLGTAIQRVLEFVSPERSETWAIEAGELEHSASTVLAEGICKAHGNPALNLRVTVRSSFTHADHPGVRVVVIQSSGTRPKSSHYKLTAETAEVTGEAP